MKKTIQIITLILLVTTIVFSGSKKIVVNLVKQEAYAYEGKTLVYKGWISSGRKKFATPTGRYRVLEKDKDHVSNEWPNKIDPKTGKKGGAKMPYMLRLTWSGIALHLGYTPNRPASHGCVRLKDGFAQNLFEWADIGTRVIIKGKAPKRVARRGRGFTDYIALVKAKPKYKKRKKRAKVAKVSREKLIKYYAKFTHKKLNRMLRKNSAKKRWVLKSSKYSKKSKARQLKEINRLASIIRAAKSIKYKRYSHKRVAKKIKYKRYRHKRVAKKIHKKHKKVSISRNKINNTLRWRSAFGLNG